MDQNISLNIFDVPQKKESLSGLEQHEGETVMTEYAFLGELSLSLSRSLVKNNEKWLVLMTPRNYRASLQHSRHLADVFN